MNLRVNINICRVCMTSDNGASLMDDKELGEKFVFTTRLKLNANEDMPSIICSKCSKRLRIAYDFVKLAHESENNLKAFLLKISKDFQLVTKHTTDKCKINEEDEDDELLSTILDESADRETDESKKLFSELVPVEKDKGADASSKSLSKRKTTAGETHEKLEQTPLKDPKFVVNGVLHYSIENRGSKLLKDNVKKGNTNNEMKSFKLISSNEHIEIVQDELDKISNFNVKGDVDLNELVNVPSTTNDEPQNEASSDQEILILDYTDEESHTELEILEENVQPSEDTRSSLGEVDQQPGRSDGFFKEYQAMLEEGDEYLEDNSMQSKTAATNDLRLYDAREELLEDEDLEMKTMEEPDIGDEQVVDTAQQQQLGDDSIETVEKETKEKRKSHNKTIGRGVSAKSPKKYDALVTSKRFYCFKCKRDFSTKTNLTRHMVTHEGNRPFQCHVCNKSFSQNVSLKQHMYTHTGEKPYQCQVCHRGFTQCKSLVFHMRRHTGEKPFPCEKCGALFRQKDGLKTHILRRHTIKSQHGSVELITCAICKEILADNNSLQEHMKKHLNDYVRVDSTMSCANREGNASENSDVLLGYIDDDPLHGKNTVFLEESAQDSANDMGSSAHVVDLMTTSALEPSRAKKYQCRKCFKCFAIKKNLVRHLTTHNIAVVSTEFACKLCELRFSSSEVLHAHNLKEHNSSVQFYQCDLCQSVFSSAEELRKHSNLPHTFKSHKLPHKQTI